MTPPPSADEVFVAALALTDPSARSAYLDRACAGRADLREELESLLAAATRAGTFLESPLTDAAAVLRETGDVLAGPPAERAGSRIGRYKLLEEIGEGGFGVVWMAEQEEPVRRRVALKIIKLGMDTREVVARFEAERQALALMDHPNIAKVLDGGATDTGRPYFVMDLVKGDPITKFCDERRLSTRQRLELFLQVCHAVQHAHQKGIIHRDLKPSNILVTVQDDRPSPKVIDFGVAKATQARLSEKTLFTRLQQWIGTPAYMSPEQAGLGRLDVDTRSDVYSLGVVLYELLTGRTPFDTQKLLAAGYDAVMRTIREEDPPKPSTRLSTLQEVELSTTAAQRGSEPARLNRLVRGDLDWIVMKALEKDRSRRYETASALAQDLERHLGHEPVLARPPSNLYRLQKLVRRNKLAFAAGSLVSASLVLGLGISTMLFVQEKAARERAVAAEQQAEQARAEETQQREKATAKAQESLDRLVRLQNANGISRMEEDELAASLPWFAEALRALQGQPEREELQRIRLNSVLRECPKPVQMLFHGGPVTTAHFGRNGRRVVTASRDHTARVWDPATGQPVGNTLQHAGIVWQAVFSADGQRVVTASADGTARVWDAETGQPVTPALAHQGPVVSAVFSPNGKLVATASQDRTARLWDAESGESVAVVKGHGDAVRQVVFSPSGELLATGSDDSRVRIWPTRTAGTVSPAVLLYSGPLTALQFSASAKYLMASSIDASVRTHVVSQNYPYLYPTINYVGPVLHATFSPDDRYLVTALGTGAAWVYDALSGEPKGPELLHRGAIHSAQFDPESRRVVTASADQTAALWEVSTGERLASLRHGGAVQMATFSPDGRFVLSASEDGAARLWPVLVTQSFYRRVRTEPPTWHSVTDRDGKLRLLRDERQMEIATIECLAPQVSPGPRIQHAGTIRTGAFSPDGRRLATGSDDQTARVWSAETGKAISPPLDHRAPVWCLAFSANGRLLATATADRSIRVWDAATGEPLTPNLRHDGPITGLVFSADGRSLTAGGDSGLPQRWDLTPTRLPIPALAGLVELLASRKLDATTTSLEPSSPVRMRELWDSLGKTHLPALVADTAKTVAPAPRTNQASVSIPARDPRTGPNQLDLTRFYNAALTRSWQTPELERLGDMDLSELPRGLVEFGGITFDARGIVQVSGQSMRAQGGEYPEQIRGIPVNRQCQRIHFLHGTGWSTHEGVEIGAYVIHYADGQRRILPLVYGHDVRDWYFFESLPVTSREARLVWLGANQRARADGAHLQLYVRSWENPAPDVEITSIDLVSAMTACAPFIIAVTLNDLPMKGPDVQVEHARQEEQAQAVAREVSQAVMQGHYEPALRRLEEKWKSDQAQFGPTNAHTLQTLRQLVDLTGCLADWARCVEFARRYTALSGDDPLVARDCAAAALLAGDERTYRDVCQHMVTRYAKTTDAIEAERAAKLCFLAPNALADLGPALRLARMAVESATNNLWFRLAQGMGEFRSGQAEVAIQWLEPALVCNELHIATLAGYVASLAHHRLGASERARAALTNANTRFDAFLQQGFVTGGGWEEWWFDPAASMALRLEAEKTVLGQPVWARPTVASLAATRQAWWARQREARASSGSSPARPSPATLVGQAVPGAFKLGLLGGGEFVLPNPATTNVLLLDFWASWCGPCREAMPVLAEIGRDYAGRGVRCVAVNLREPPEVIRRFLDSAKLDPTVALDADGRVAQAFQVRALPTMVLIDRKGVVAWVHEGSTLDLKPRLTEAVRGLLDRDRCIENLKMLGLAAQLWAVDHGNVMPPDVHSMSNEVSSTQVFTCPGDTGRRAATDWGSLTTNNVSYEFLAPSVPVPASPGRRQRVVFHCPVHDNVVPLDGAVRSRPSPGAPDQLLRENGILYFGPPGATTDGQDSAPSRPRDGSGGGEPGTPASPSASPEEVTTFMQACRQKPGLSSGVATNPRRVPLLLAAIEREPAGPWVGLLQGFCFGSDQAKPAVATPSTADLTAYLPRQQFPKCPDGGTYDTGHLNQPPRCSTPGHELSNRAD